MFNELDIFNSDGFFWCLSHDIGNEFTLETLDEIHSVINPGDVVFVKKGLYYGANNSHFDINGTIEEPIYYKCEKDSIFTGTIVISGSNLIFEKANFSGEVTVKNSKNVTFNGCTASKIKIIDSEYCIMKNCEKCDILFENCQRCQIEKCDGNISFTGKSSTDYSCKIKEFRGAISIQSTYCKIIKSTITNLNIIKSNKTFLHMCVFDDT